MANNFYKQRPMSVAAINLDMNDGRSLPREEHISYPRQSYNFDEEPSRRSTKKKTHYCTIILIVIFSFVVLISVAGFIIAIVSLTVHTNAASSATDSTIPVTATLVTTPPQCSSSPPTYFQYTTITPPQCLNYTINTDATRNIGYTSSINYCDDVPPFTNTTSVWIRFQNPAGIVIANSPVPPNYCGTLVTGWYAGQYPSTAFTTAISIACFYYSTNTCNSCLSISVTNCLNFYVFFLPQPQTCNYRYCTL